MVKDHELQKNFVVADTEGENYVGSPKAAKKTTEAATLILAPLDRNVGTRSRGIQNIFRAY